MTHLALFESFREELQDIIEKHNRRVSGKVDRDFLIQARIDLNRGLMDKLHQQIRALRLMRGEDVPGEVQYAETVLIGMGGMGVVK